MVVVRLLGPVDVIDGAGNSRSIGSPLRRTLLALLALRAGEVVSADWLLEHAWDGHPPDSGRRALRFHVSQLRKELGAQCEIETRAGGYRLAVLADEIDAIAAEAVADAARLDSDPADATNLYARALGMWRGDPFGDCAPCSTLDDEAARLDAVRLAIVENRFRGLLDAGGGRELVADLSLATAQYPLRESLWSMLMVAQYRAGLQADALRTYERVRRVLADSLGLDPSIELQDLQRRVLQHDPTLLSQTAAGSDHNRMAARRRHLLPAPATTLIDGGDRVAAAKRMVLDNRLVTLTGPGGIGKTRLAVEVGWSSLDVFDDGVWLIELAPVANADSVVAAVASALSIPLQIGMTDSESIVDWLNGRHAMLILDNCEHVLDGARSLLSSLVAHCPTMTFVATSRQPLEVSGERVLVVSLLSPDIDGVALFLDRAAAADSSFVPNDQDHRIVAAICRRLDGLPLAIELAAARVRSMSTLELLERLDDRFQLLRRAGNGIDHHDVLQATVEWSYRLLSESERAVFDQLSVFAGGFDARAADTVCSVDGASTSAVVDALSALVDRSMIVADRQRGGTRYDMLETLREFGNTRLREADQLHVVRDRHLQHYLRVAEETNRLFLGKGQAEGVANFAREWDNLRLAHQWAIETEALRAAEQLVISVHAFADIQNRLELGQWVDQTLALTTADRVPRPQTFAVGAFWAYAAEHMSRGDELLARGVEIADGSFDDPGTLMCLTMAVRRQQKDAALLDDSRKTFMQVEEIASRMDLDREWWLLIELADHSIYGHPEEADAHVLRLVEAAERLRIPMLMCSAALEMGHAANVGDPSDLGRALAFFEKARSIARDNNDLIDEAEALRAIARASVSVEPANGRAACHEALTMLYDIRYWMGIWRVMESSALHLAAVEKLREAAVLLGNLEAHHSAWGAERMLGFRERTHLATSGQTFATECMARGAAMDRFQIVEYTLVALNG